MYITEIPDNDGGQKEIRLKYQRELEEHQSRYGIKFTKINILGQWHSIYNGNILKAPIPNNIWIVS